MNKPFILIIFILSSCNSPSTQYSIWPKGNKLISEIQTPSGYKVTPQEVWNMVMPRKYVITIYAIKDSYIVGKEYPSFEQAQKYGTRVNGITGKIAQPPERNQYSLLFIKKFPKP